MLDDAHLPSLVQQLRLAIGRRALSDELLRPSLGRKRPSELHSSLVQNPFGRLSLYKWSSGSSFFHANSQRS
jgi:hypothetical protein